MIQTGQQGYAFPTLTTNALEHKVYAQFNYYTGRAVDVEDENGVVTSAYCTDALDRPTKIVSAANQAAASQRTYD